MSLDDPVPVTGLPRAAAAALPDSWVRHVGTPQPIDAGYSLDVETDRDALLVIADNAYPGWAARVDGTEVDIGVAYGVFKALALAAGAHRVELTYRSLPLMVGAAVSALTAVMLLLWAVGNRATGAARPELTRSR